MGGAAITVSPKAIAVAIQELVITVNHLGRGMLLRSLAVLSVTDIVSFHGSTPFRHTRRLINYWISE